MTGDRDQLRFYVDESALGLGKALEAARRDTYAGHKLIPECPLGALDPDWMPAVAARDLVVIARDRRIRTKPQELQRFAEVGLRVFWIAGKKDLPTWGWLVRVVRHWDAIEGAIDQRGPRSVVLRDQRRRPPGNRDLTSAPLRPWYQLWYQPERISAHLTAPA